MRLVASISCLALLFPGSLKAADKVILRLNLQPGMTWTFDQTQDMSTDAKATFNGQTQPFTTMMHSRRVGKAEVVAASGGLPSSIRLTFGDACESSMSDSRFGPKTINAGFPYMGKTVTVTRGADDKVNDDFTGDPVHPSFVNELDAMISQEEALFPKQPVEVGEEWPADPQLLSRDLQLQGDDRAGMTLKLLSVKEANGRRIAEVKVSAAIVRTSDGVRSKWIMQGVALVDVQTGHARKLDLKGTLETSGHQQGIGPNGGPAVIEGTGTIATSISSEITSGGAAAGAGSAPAAAGDNPLAPPAASNPLGPTDPFVGRFSDGNLTIDLDASGNIYSGTITLGNRKLPAKAKSTNQSLEGSFDSGGNVFPFSAKLAGDTLTLMSGGKTYTLKRAVVNPLGGSSSANPADPSAAIGTGQLPGGYSVVTATDAGKALSARKPGANSVTAALQSTLSDLARYFDGKPHIVSAYEDVRDHRGGGVSFSASLHGQAVKGLVTCKIDEKDAAVAVIYCKSDGTGADWARLLSAPAGDGAPTAPPPLREYQFPDGTGSIGLADGWTTKATSCHGLVIIEGPADQAITLGFIITAVTPTSTAVRMNQQLNAQARRLGGRELPLNLFVAPLTEPVAALNNLMPQVSQRNRQNGGMSLVMDHLAPVREIQPILPGGKAAVCQYGLTIGNGGQDKHHHVLAQVEVDPIGNTGDTFMFGLTGASAPDSTFNRDLPTMLAIIGSLKENAAVIAAQTRQQIDAQNQRFAAQQRAQKEVQAAYDDYNKSQARNSVIRSRSVDDFDEVLRGYRTVEDTSTGHRTSVDLGNVDHVVDTLNQYQPGRYKQIPLRDEADPLPPR